MQTPTTNGTEEVVKPATRYVALDAMRGFVMLALVSKGFGLGALKGDSAMDAITRQFKHLPWEGLVAYELIMPAFMFMVGAALPFALARRAKLGATFGQNLGHIAFRVFKLILLGQILTTLHKGRYAYEPYETLTQLGISCFFAFPILQLRSRWQPVAAAGFLLLNWALYQLFPGSAGPFSPSDNVGVVVDQAVFSLNHAGSWATINFLGSSITVLFGAWTAMLLLSSRTHVEKARILIAAILGSFALTGVLMPFVPLIHKAWTLTFTFCHTGFVLLAVLAFFWLFDWKGYRKLAFPLVVVGMNSIFIYLLMSTLHGWFDKSLAAFTGRFQFAGSFGPMFQVWAVTLAMWYVCFCLYKRRIFFKV